MSEPTPASSSAASWIASNLTHTQKMEMLEVLSEDDFRDRVVRPIYQRRGLKHLRDTCGPEEEGKDCLFVGNDALGELMVIAIQTKKGGLSLGGDPARNLVVAETQIKTALETPVILDDNTSKVRPAQVHLCCSGKISNRVRERLQEEFDTQRVKVLGAEEIIGLVDKLYPEFWLGLNADKFPYVQALRRHVCLAADIIKLSDVTGVDGDDSPILDDNYVPIRLTRVEEKATKRSGEVIMETEFIDIGVESLPKQSERLVLLTADGGCGKTTCLRRLAFVLLQRVIANSEDGAIPVLLRAIEVGAAAGSITDLAASVTKELAGGSCPFSVTDLQEGRVAFLIDALDEVHSSRREAVLAKIAELHNTFSECLVVVTSRDYRTILELSLIARFTNYRVMPVTLRQVDGLVTKAVSLKKVDAEVVKTTLRKLHEVHGLQLSPMLVTAFLAAGDFTKQDIPPNITEIFKKFTELMLGRWDLTKGLKQQHHAVTKDFLLKKLAFEMHRRGVRTILTEECESLFADMLAKRDLGVDPNTIFDEIVHRSGILKTDGRIVEWRHHLLQEFFAGRGAPDSAFFADVIGSEWWRSPMVFHFGERADAFSDLWSLVERAKSLTGPALFDAAVTIGLCVQACYLAESPDRSKGLTWVVESLAQSMEDYRDALADKHGTGKPLLSLATVYALGRDAVASRTIARVPEKLESPTASSLFAAPDPEKYQFWRLIGLLEAGEYAVALQALPKFKTGNRDLIFALSLAIGWCLHTHPPRGDELKQLQKRLDVISPTVEDMRQRLFQEFKTLLFEIRQGKLFPLPEPEADREVVGEDGKRALPS